MPFQSPGNLDAEYQQLLHLWQILLYCVLPELPGRHIQTAVLILFPATMLCSETMTSDDSSDVSHGMLHSCEKQRASYPLSQLKSGKNPAGTLGVGAVIRLHFITR